MSRNPWQEEAVQVQSGMLQTDIIRARDEESKKLLIALHGLGDSMEGYRWLPQMLQVPELNYLLVNAPDAYYGGFAWFDFAGDASPGVDRSYKALNALLDDLPEKGFSVEETVLFGFSQGCLMTIETGLRYPKRFAGCVGVSGWGHQPERLLAQLSPVAKEQRFLLTHGTRDPLVPIEKVRPQIEQWKGAGLNVQWCEFDKEHTIIETEIDCIRGFILDSLHLSNPPQADKSR